MESWQQLLVSNPIFKQVFPFESRFLDVDGHQVHYVDEGNGPVILLLHGNPTFSFVYRNMIKKLKSQYRLIALDYPGFGLSVAKENYDYKPISQSNIVEIFVKKLNLTNITLFVQDWGGPIGLGFAGRCPELIANIIIGNTWAWPVNGDFHFEAFSKFMGGPIGKFLILKKNLFVNALIPAGTPKNKVSGEILKIYQEAMNKERRFVTHILPKEITQSKLFLQDVERGLEKIKNKPTLIFWGNKDFAFRKKELQRFEKIFINHKTVILEGAGHYIQEDDPQTISQEILKWVN